MKKFAFIFALFVLLKPVLPFVEYATMYNYIKNELCENKRVPEIKCNGKCHLSKELSKASEQENQSGKKTLTSEMQLFFFNFSEPFSVSQTILFYSYKKDEVPDNLYKNQFTLSFLKPPIFLG